MSSKNPQAQARRIFAVEYHGQVHIYHFLPGFGVSDVMPTLLIRNQNCVVQFLSFASGNINIQSETKIAIKIKKPPGMAAFE